MDAWGLLFRLSFYSFCFFEGLKLGWSKVGGFSLNLVQYGAWLSGWSSFLLVILLVFSVLLLDLSSHNGSFLDFELSCSRVWLNLHKLL